MKRTEVINLVASCRKSQTYLEIGIRNPEENFDLINVPYKYGVDPAALKPFHGFVGTSDDFFKQNEQKFDLIFVDGWHSRTACKRDIDNSFNALNPGGIIIVHDINPVKRIWQSLKVSGKCWLVIAEMRISRPDLWIGCIFDDDGCAVIKPNSSQVLYPKTELSWLYFHRHKKALMNGVTPEELKRNMLCD